MTLRHTKAHLTRAVLEGVSYGLKDSLSLMQELGIRPSKIILSGGGARSELWKQMLADIFETSCCLVNATEGAAYGAALLAAVGCGSLPSVEDASREWIRETEQVETIGPNFSEYKKNYGIYQDLYPALKKTFYNLSEE